MRESPALCSDVRLAGIMMPLSRTLRAQCARTVGYRTLEPRSAGISVTFRHPCQIRLGVNEIWEGRVMKFTRFFLVCVLACLAAIYVALVEHTLLLGLQRPDGPSLGRLNPRAFL